MYLCLRKLPSNLVLLVTSPLCPQPVFTNFRDVDVVDDDLRCNKSQEGYADTSTHNPFRITKRQLPWGQLPWGQLPNDNYLIGQLSS